MTLYDINAEILNCVDMDTGEILDTDRLESLQMDRDEKIENLCLWQKDLRAEAKAIAEEIKALTERKRAAENKADRLKEYISGALEGEKFKTSKVSVSYRSSESVDVYDWSMLDDKYLKAQNPVPDKTLIKKDLKEGLQILGAELVKKTNIQIK